jgi:periplasmic protein CpxP/Spy
MPRRRSVTVRRRRLTRRHRPSITDKKHFSPIPERHDAHHHPGGRRAGLHASTNDPRAQVEQHIADMHATLHITPAEETPWDQFAQVMLDNAQQTRELVSQNAAALPTRNAAQIMQSNNGLAQQHPQDVQTLTDSFDTLYAALSPEQKQEADAMSRENAVRHQARQGKAVGG